MTLFLDEQKLLFISNNLADLNLVQDCLGELLYPLIRTSKLIPIVKSYSQNINEKELGFVEALF